MRLGMYQLSYDVLVTICMILSVAKFPGCVDVPYYVA